MTQRRAFLKHSLGHSALLAAAAGAPALARAAAPPTALRDRTLRLYNTHTGESLTSTYFAEGRLQPSSLADINKLLRDHRNNQVAPIDPALIVLLDQVTVQARPGSVVHIISGYRSPASNQLLAETTNGVARHSMHLEGKAIDVRMPGVALADLRKAALAAGGGGVGYYPDSQFVHMDTGRVRRW